jgi:membrane associated rhomboid family serine protease
VPSPIYRPAFLLAVEQPELVAKVEGVLREAGIAYSSGLQVDPKPMVVFTVGEEDLEAAKGAVNAMLQRRVAAAETRLAEAPPPPFSGGRAGHGDEEREEGEDEDESEVEPHEVEPATSPRGAIQAAVALILLHFAILFAFVGPDPTARHLASIGGLRWTSEGFSPLGLLTSLFLHSDVKHVLWNGVSLVAFTVPAVHWMGYARTGIVYLLSGLAGGAAALATYAPGTVTVGSSGAVAGLFGAWLAIRLLRARHAPKTRHAFVRALGIGFLVLPTLVPSGPTGDHKVSVASHLGGMAAGLVLGAIHELRRARAASARGVF